MFCQGSATGWISWLGYGLGSSVAPGCVKFQAMICHWMLLLAGLCSGRAAGRALWSVRVSSRALQSGRDTDYVLKLGGTTGWASQSGWPMALFCC